MYFERASYFLDEDFTKDEFLHVDVPRYIAVRRFAFNSISTVKYN